MTEHERECLPCFIKYVLDTCQDNVLFMAGFKALIETKGSISGEDAEAMMEGCIEMLSRNASILAAAMEPDSDVKNMTKH